MPSKTYPVTVAGLQEWCENNGKPQPDVTILKDYNGEVTSVRVKAEGKKTEDGTEEKAISKMFGKLGITAQ